MKDGAKIFLKNQKTSQFIFVLRDNKPSIPNPNMWSLLGGGIEKGESPEQAIRRELKEEVNIDIPKLISLSKEHINLKAGDEIHEVVIHFFLGVINIQENELQLNEGQELRSFSLENFLKKDNIIPKLKDYIIKNRARLEEV